MTYMKSLMRGIEVMSNKSNKRQPKKKMKPMASLGMLIVYGVSAYLIYVSSTLIYQMFTLQQQIKSTQSELTSIQNENDYLTAQRDKLKDPNYVQEYARGNYMMSKDGETIFYLPSDDNQPTE